MDNHFVKIDNRAKAVISEVEDLDAFDENVLWADLKEGGLEITGENLNIEKLDLEERILVITGKIQSFSYIDKKIKERKFKMPFMAGKRK